MPAISASSVPTSVVTEPRGVVIAVRGSVVDARFLATYRLYASNCMLAGIDRWSLG